MKQIKYICLLVVALAIFLSCKKKNNFYEVGFQQTVLIKPIADTLIVLDDENLNTLIGFEYFSKRAHVDYNLILGTNLALTENRKVVSAGVSEKYYITHFKLDSLLNTMNIAPGTQAAIYWTVQAKNPEFSRTEEARKLNIQRFGRRSITPEGVSWTLDNSKSDEFNELDPGKWSNAPLWYYGGVTGDFAFKSGNTTVSGGIVSIMAKKEDHQNLPDPNVLRHYTAGCLKSKFEVGGNTYIEVRAKMIKSLANVCAAIWISDEPVLEKSPNIEIDIQETKDADDQPHLLNSSLLTWPKPGNGNTVPGSKNYYFSSGLDEDFHLYGLERRNGKLKFYLDGVLYWEWDAAATPEFVTQLRPIIFSIEGHAGVPVSEHLPSDFQIDWVRVYNAN
ncbi:SusE outer membrane protein [Pedobacter sp. ok626]|uniref:family 16 glycosylhydrolase n=1 Tax=Pedobacter sp. ok626 TaxID=1761882 RepID=UPI00088E3282|nr:family 16 glycosylhydrolase [Pedobacter sp. ok626]SDK56238.1 SusE outer membrane protein [Pedobacter sp. ok626]